jgi:hypothetical protein
MSYCSRQTAITLESTPKIVSFVILSLFTLLLKFLPLKTALLDQLPFIPSSSLSDSPYDGLIFNSVSAVAAADVLNILKVCPLKFSPLEFVPTPLLKSCLVFSHLIAALADLSFSQGRFPT